MLYKAVFLVQFYIFVVLIITYQVKVQEHHINQNTISILTWRINKSCICTFLINTLHLFLYTTFYFTVVATTSKCSRHSSNSTVKRSTTKSRCRRSSDFSYCRTKTQDKCSLSCPSIHLSNKVRPGTITWYCCLVLKRRQALNYRLLSKQFLWLLLPNKQCYIFIKAFQHHSINEPNAGPWLGKSGRFFVVYRR